MSSPAPSTVPNLRPLRRPEITAHRGWSGPYPESTRAAYLGAIDVAERTGRALLLEGDLQLCASGEIVMHHDATLQRTGGRPEKVGELTLAELRTVDFGSWRGGTPTEDEKAVVTLPELLDLIVAARARGVDVGAALETKHDPVTAGQLDEAAWEIVTSYGWTGADAPLRVISFYPDSIRFWSEHAPTLRRSFLQQLSEQGLGDGTLPYGTNTVGVDLAAVRADPDYARRLAAHGNQLHVWTANEPADLRWCLELGATGLTTDYADRAFEVTAGLPA